MAVVTVIKMAVEETGGSVSQRQGGQGAGVDADGGAIAAAVSACALLGVVASFATGSTAPFSSEGDAPITIGDVMAKQTMSYAAMQKSRADGVAMLQKMTMRPVINVPNARAHLGASWAQVLKCLSEFQRLHMIGTGAKTDNSGSRIGRLCCCVTYGTPTGAEGPLSV